MVVALVALHSGHHNKTPSERFTAVESASPWRNADLSLEALLAHIQAGRAFVSCQLTGNRRTLDDYNASNVVVLDLDGDLDLEAFWARPAAQRHCALTYTSCSHGDQAKQEASNAASSDRFRALFPFAESFKTPDEHAAAYDWIIEQLGFTPADPSGRKPVQLWYGNDAALIERNPDWASANWDVIEDIRANARRPAPPVARVNAPEDLQTDSERAEWLLLHLLRPSADGEYLHYWQRVLNAAAASGSDRVWAAFIDWHQRGHHIGKNSLRKLERSRSKSGQRMSAGQGLGTLFALAKEQNLQWKELLPDGLKFVVGGAQASPRSLMRSRPALGGAVSLSIQPPSDPVAAEFQQTRQLMQRQQATAPLPITDTPAAEQPLDFLASLKLLIERMYHLTVRAVHITEAGEEQLSESDAAAQLLQYREQLFAYQVISREPQHIETMLLDRFRDEHGLIRRTKLAMRVSKLFDGEEDEHVHLLPNLMAVGQPYLFYARQGLGKTTLALLLARSVLGVPGYNQFLDFPPVPISDYGKRRALFIASDGGSGAKADLIGYARRLNLAGAEWIDKHLDLITSTSTDTAKPWRMDLFGLAFLARTLDEAGASGKPYSLLVVDSLKAVAPDGVRVGDQIITDYIATLTEICQPRGVTMVLIHHQSKEADHAQGAAGIAEMVHGVFRIREQEQDGRKQRIFCVDKTRLDPKGNREIPIDITGGSLTVGDVLDTGNRGELLLLDGFRQHYDRYVKKVAHLSSDAPERRYRGINAQAAMATLMELGIRHESWTSVRVVADLVKQLCKQGELEKRGSTKDCHYTALGVPSVIPAEADDQFDLPGWS